MANEPEKNIETTGTNPEPGKEKELAPDELASKIKQLEAENVKLRDANTAASADASKWKKQYQETLSTEARRTEEQKEQAAAMQQELENLRAERNVANYKSRLLSIGFEDVLAQEVAENLNAGDTAKLFDGLQRFIVAHDKSLKEAAFRTNPTLQQGGSAQKAITKEQFDKMGYKERVEVYQQYPDLYKEFTK